MNEDPENSSEEKPTTSAGRPAKRQSHLEREELKVSTLNRF